MTLITICIASSPSMRLSAFAIAVCLVAMFSACTRSDSAGEHYVRSGTAEESTALLDQADSPLPTSDMVEPSAVTMAATSADETTTVEGIEVLFPKDGALLADRWIIDGPIRVSELTESARARTLQILGRAIRKYPPEMIKASLDRILAFDSITVNDTPIGGSFFGKSIVIVVHGGERIPAYRDDRIERVFHHELATVLLRQHPDLLSQTAWCSSNPDSFVYGGSGMDAIRSGKASLASKPSLFSSGFFCEYAQSSWHNDFCVVAAELFMNRRWFWQAIEMHERLRTKATLAIEFYKSIDPYFTSEYFHILPSG